MVSGVPILKHFRVLKMYAEKLGTAVLFSLTNWIGFELCHISCDSI